MKLAKLFPVSIFAVLAPIKAVVIAALVLVVIDLISGLVAAKRRGEKITSFGIRRTVTKLAIYELAIVCAFLVQTYFTGSDMPVLKLITSLIGLAELKSILENLDSINRGSFFGTIVKFLNGGRDGEGNK